MLWMRFRTSNNEDKYKALIHDIRMAKVCGATQLVFYRDSNLVVQQTMNLCNAISDNMIAYRDLYNSLEGDFDGCELRHVGRESNEEAGKLANIGSTCAPVPPGVFLEQICKRSIKHKTPKGTANVAGHSGTAPPEKMEAPEELETYVELLSLMQVLVI